MNAWRSRDRRARLDADEAPSLRRITLSGMPTDYRLLRSRRRTIGIEIGLDGLTVRAPRRASIRDIEAALAERSRWVLRTLETWRGRRREVLPRAWRSGASIVIEGRALSLSLYPSRVRDVSADLFNLTVRHPQPDDEARIARFVGLWLREQALLRVAPRVAVHAAKLARPAPPVKLSNARGEWGSCNSRGVIRLNWRLVQLPPELADYVVAHEVAHLVELNHSPRFWAVVEALLPGHARHRRALADWTALLAA